MIMLTVTKPRRKLRRILKGVGLLLLLLAVVPGLYYTLSSVGAMSMFASGTMGESGQSGTEQGGQPTDEAPAPEGAGGEQQAAAQAGDEDSDAADNDEDNAENADNEKAAAGDELKEDTAAAEDSAGAEEKPAEKPAEKAGLWQALQEVIFGRRPEVHIYQNLG